jgi:DnaA family protein
MQVLAGHVEAEHALFDLYNRLRAEGASLLLASAQPLPALALGLPDLRSRLSACVQAPLSALDESARRALVQEWAAARGIDLEPAVLDWLFARAARDLRSLHALFERIDRAALAERRRITIPFLRGLLAERD